MVKPEFRAFDALLFWDQVAWVAETISDDYWYVAQGSTPEKALENFRHGLMATAALQLQEGHVPFNDTLKTPDEAIRRWRKAELLSRHPNPQKGHDYRFVVSAHWGEGVKIRPVRSRPGPSK